MGAACLSQELYYAVYHTASEWKLNDIRFEITLTKIGQ